MSNIERFDETVARLFADLYEQFPRKVSFSAFDYLNLNISYSSLDDLDKEASEVYGKSIEKADFLLDTVSWLVESGFLYGKVKNEQGMMFITKECIDLTLTPKGLELLKLMPSSLEAETSLGDELVTVIKSGAKEAGGKLVSEALTKFGSINQLLSLISSSIT